MHYSLQFPTGEVQYLFEEKLDPIERLADGRPCVLLSDSNIVGMYPGLFQGRPTIVIPAGEGAKSWQCIDTVTQQLLVLGAQRKTLLIGIGGGVVTDITGFVAAIYMRGIAFGYVSTSLLGMADAAVGGKNGINTGLYKNILGTIQQPEFILFDTSFLDTLPAAEWSNGFAEIIKYACLFDTALFEELSNRSVSFYKEDKAALVSLIARCVDWKNKTVLADEKESNARKLLNFGHTAGHALENLYQLPHGSGVGLGMLIACGLSESVLGLSRDVKAALKRLLERYDLPVTYSYDTSKVMEVLKMDKKRNTDTIDYILLNNIGEAVIQELSLATIEQALISFAHESHYS